MREGECGGEIMGNMAGPPPLSLWNTFKAHRSLLNRNQLSNRGGRHFPNMFSGTHVFGSPFGCSGCLNALILTVHLRISVHFPIFKMERVYLPCFKLMSRKRCFDAPVREKGFEGIHIYK